MRLDGRDKLIFFFLLVLLEYFPLYLNSDFYDRRMRCLRPLGHPISQNLPRGLITEIF